MRLAHSAIVVAAVLAAACGDDRRSRTPIVIAARDAGGSGVDSGIAVDAGATRDAGVLPGRDGGTATDRDAGRPPKRDGGPPPMCDAGVIPGRDGGTPPGRDAGPPGRDAGPPQRDAGPRDAGTTVSTIAQIQQGIIVPGTLVTTQNVVVTGVYRLGVWVQDPRVTGPYSGVRVYIATPPQVVVGDRVDVSGTVLEYFGDTEIDSATLTYLGPGTPIAPVSLTVAQAATEPYEGVLVRLVGIQTIANTWDCSLDDPGCFDTGLWQVGGSGGILVYDYVYESADWTARIGTVPITGVMQWRYNRRRVMPRTTADFGP